MRLECAESAHAQERADDDLDAPFVAEDLDGMRKRRGLIGSKPGDAVRRATKCAALLRHRFDALLIHPEPSDVVSRQRLPAFRTLQDRFDGRRSALHMRERDGRSAVRGMPPVLPTHHRGEEIEEFEAHVGEVVAVPQRAAGVGQAHHDLLLLEHLQAPHQLAIGHAAAIAGSRRCRPAMRQGCLRSRARW